MADDSTSNLVTSVNNEKRNMEIINSKLDKFAPLFVSIESNIREQTVMFKESLKSQKDLINIQKNKDSIKNVETDKLKDSDNIGKDEPRSFFGKLSDAKKTIDQNALKSGGLSTFVAIPIIGALIDNAVKNIGEKIGISTAASAAAGAAVENGFDWGAWTLKLTGSVRASAMAAFAGVGSSLGGLAADSIMNYFKMDPKEHPYLHMAGDVAGAATGLLAQYGIAKLGSKALSGISNIGKSALSSVGNIISKPFRPSMETTNARSAAETTAAETTVEKNIIPKGTVRLSAKGEKIIFDGKAWRSNGTFASAKGSTAIDEGLSTLETNASRAATPNVTEEVVSTIGRAGSGSIAETGMGIAGKFAMGGLKMAASLPAQALIMMLTPSDLADDTISGAQTKELQNIHNIFEQKGKAGVDEVLSHLKEVATMYDSLDPDKKLTSILNTKREDLEKAADQIYQQSKTEIQVSSKFGAKGTRSRYLHDSEIASGRIPPDKLASINTVSSSSTNAVPTIINAPTTVGGNTTNIVTGGSSTSVMTSVGTGNSYHHGIPYGVPAHN